MENDRDKPFKFDEGAYEDYARKMDQFVYGPTTTYFDQLESAGVALPEPGAISDVDLRTKLWEVIGGLARLRVYLAHTDHLTDRDVYAKLWHELLRGETPAVDEIGFSTELPMVSPGAFDQDTALYLKHYADETDRSHWSKDFPDDAMPAHEDPPYHRDCLLPAADYSGMPEAVEWLRANWSPSAFATNRFQTTAAALEFVQQLYDAGAQSVAIDNVVLLPNHNWTPYADTLIVDLPEDTVRRRELFELMERVGRPDTDGGETFADRGGASARLWWD